MRVSHLLIDIDSRDEINDLLDAGYVIEQYVPITSETWVSRDHYKYVTTIHAVMVMRVEKENKT